MWFEVLPSFFIMVGAFTIAQFTPGLVNLVVKKNVSLHVILCKIQSNIYSSQAYHRDLTGETKKKQYLRDIRLSGDPYIIKVITQILLLPKYF